MMHQYRDKKRIVRRNKVIRNILILCIFLILIFLGLFSFSSKIFNYIGRPMWEAKKVVLDSTGDLSYLTKTKSSLLEENRKILEENSSLKISMIDYQILKNENDKLKELLGRIPTKHNFILANILTKPNYSPYDTLIIDVGADENIIEGLIVYTNGNIPIGLISKVYPKTSLVELYSNPSRVTSGIIDELNVSVELIGRGGGNFEISVPLELIIPKGAMILLPGNQTEVVAIVEEEISNPIDPIKKVILHSPVNIQNQRWVQVKKN